METVMKLEPARSHQPLKSENPSIVLGVKLDPALIFQVSLHSCHWLQVERLFNFPC